MKAEIMTTARTATIPQMRVLYAYAYAKITGSRDVPAPSLGGLADALEELLRIATSYEITMIHKCAAIVAVRQGKA